MLQALWQSRGATRPNHRPRLRSSHWGGAAHRESPWPFGSRRVPCRHTSTPQTPRLLLDLTGLASDIVAFYKWTVGGGVVVLVMIVLGQGLYDMVRQSRRRRSEELRRPNE